MGVAQILGDVLLTVFTAGATVQIRIALIGEDISDCLELKG